MMKSKVMILKVTSRSVSKSSENRPWNSWRKWI